MTETEEICVHGLGYIGLPTATVLANAGYRVYGFDTDMDHRARLRDGTLTLDEKSLERSIESALDDGLRIVDEVRPADYHVVCVPTPNAGDVGDFDSSYVETAGEAVASVLRPDDVVVLESTVPPGTTAGRFRQVLQRSGHSAAEDFLLGYSPETILPGNTLTELHRNDRIIGTVAGRSPDRIVSLYASFSSGTMETTDATTAEFVKLVQNAFRDVNIAFANELAKLGHDFGVDSREAIALANNHPRVDILRPGPGVGGHCLPIDPMFLKAGSTRTDLIEAAREINDGMPSFVAELLSAALGNLPGNSVAILGVAYKATVSDTRMSPALAFRDVLDARGVADVRLTDPYVDPEGVDAPLCSLEEAIEGADAVVIVTDHPEYGAIDPDTFGRLMAGNVVIDTRAMIDRERWETAGFEVYTV